MRKNNNCVSLEDSRYVVCSFHFGMDTKYFFSVDAVRWIFKYFAICISAIFNQMQCDRKNGIQISTRAIYFSRFSFELPLKIEVPFHFFVSFSKKKPSSFFFCCRSKAYLMTIGLIHTVNVTQQCKWEIKWKIGMHTIITHIIHEFPHVCSTVEQFLLGRWLRFSWYSHVM